jgi:hypothetical protein
MKLMYALWGPGLDTALHGSALHRRLADAGASVLQVNVCDADVAAAKLRITTLPEPVSAVASVWCDDHAEVTRVLSSVTDQVSGWIVAERAPLAPPQTGNGKRCDALANVTLLRIPGDMTKAEWLHRWHDEHTPVAIETQATFGYIQNTVTEPVTPGPDINGLVEELFPMAALSDMHAFWGSGGDQAELHHRLTRMLASVAAFGADRDIDVIPTSRYVYTLG